MSKNTNIADLINYISVDGSGNVVLTTGGQVATQSYVTTAVSNLVNSAPSTLDTLNELATALGNDANFATTVTTSIATKLPLAGGTLTGALSGTSATFSGDLTIDTNTLYVDSTNNRVGIGTLGSAGYLLDVFGTATFGASTTVGNKVHIGSGAVPSGAAGIGMWATGSNLLSIVGLGDTTIDSRGSYLIINPNGGNVGIGTTTPTGTYGKLSVAGGISILNDNNAKLEIGRYSSGISNSYIKLGANSNNLFITNNSDTIDIFTITNNGAVGIGITTPSRRLHVYGSSTVFEGILVENSTSNSYALYQSRTANSNLWQFGTWNDNSFRVGTSGVGDFLNITSGGNIGIGTSSPSDKLQVLGSLRWGSATNNIVTSNDGGGVYMELSAPNSSTRNLRIQGINNAGNKYSAIRLEAGIEEIAFVTADVERMRISSPGDLYLYNGSIQQQGVWTVFNSGFTDGTSSFNFDIGVGSEGGGGNIFKVEAGFAHFSGMAYNCLAEFYISTRGTGSEITDVIRRDTSLAGSFTAWKTTSTVLRINKSAGTYPGGGRYWIKVTKVNY